MEVCDLHTHSYYSDGDASPTQVVRKAKKAGVKILALTDHNSVSGVKEAIAEGNKLGIRVIPGIELRSKEGEILGYFVDVNNKSFLNRIKEIQKRTKKVFMNAVLEFRKKGFSINLPDVLDMGLKRDNVLVTYLLKYLAVKSGWKIKDLKAIMKGGKFEPKFSAEEVVKIIQKAGGVPVLAHPWYSHGFLEDSKIKKLVKAGLEGIEIDNGGRGEERSSLVIKKIEKFAEKYNLILTSGSDYHGDSIGMSNIHKIGKHNCDEKIVKKLGEARE